MNTIPNRSRLVSIVLPARNEQAGIGRTLRSLPIATLETLGFETEVVVLDGNSADRTAQIAREWGATVIPDRRAGKGYAVRDAIPHFQGDFVVMLDADGSYPPDTIPSVVKLLASGRTDVVMGVRRPRPGAMSVSHILGNAALCLVASTLYRRACYDLCTGLWGFTIEALRSFPLRSKRFGLEAELFALTSRLGLRLHPLKIDYLPRAGQGSLSFGADGLRILRRLMRARFVPLYEGAPAQGGSPRPVLSQEVRT